MNLENIRSYCLNFPGATEDIKWQKQLVFSIGGKMFAITGLDEVPVSLSFKVPDEQFEQLSELPGYKPAPYLARAKWIAIADVSGIDEKQLKDYVEASYQLVKDKLPKKVREKLT